MKKILTTVAALGLAAVINTGHSTEAKADGGAVAIGVGVYLLADALVGRHCYREEWPFNIVRKVGDELHGYPGCPPYHRHRYHRHHHHHHHHHRHY
jgi:hypothetical protein